MSENAPVLLAAADLVAFAEYLDGHFARLGQPGVPRFDLKPPRRYSDIQSIEELYRQWARPVSVLGWSRSWGIKEGGAIVGHISAHGCVPGERAHRAVIGMGVAPSHHRRGLGALLLSHAIEWARASGIAWLDLHAFSDNAPAIALYRRFGFAEIGIWKDLYRVEGESIDDLMMTLHLHGHA